MLLFRVEFKITISEGLEASLDEYEVKANRISEHCSTSFPNAHCFREDGHTLVAVNGNTRRELIAHLTHTLSFSLSLSPLFPPSIYLSLFLCCLCLPVTHVLVCSICDN